MVKKSGVIEGFYGIPWTFDQRLSMIDFLKDIGMNSYIYAPKDDPYHNKKWREAYPAAELEEIKALARRANDKNVDFIWAIHPGQNLFDFDDYENEIAKIYAKYRQLLGAGVKSFGLCMDDIDKNLAYQRRNDHIRLVRDLASFVGENCQSPLYFVHPWYNDDWINEEGFSYEALLRDIDNINIMWTGPRVVSPISHKSNENFYKRLGKRPYIWFNWPVNDYKPGQIFIEIFEFFDDQDLNFDGFFLNPMNQPELSKIAIYQANEYLKNPSNYSPWQAFERALAYVDKDVAGDILDLAPSFFASLVYERSDQKLYLADDDLIKAHQAKDMAKFRNLLEKKKKSIDSIRKNHTNKALYGESSPFIESLDHLLDANLYRLSNDKESCRVAYEAAKSIKIQILDEDGMKEKNVETSKFLDGLCKEFLKSS